MAQLAIKGHATRGKEVIEILEMLGGKNQNIVYSGKDTFHYYFIDNETGYIRTKLYTNNCWTKLTYNIFTLEEFLEKFPYKVRDRVKIPNCDVACRVTNMIWNGIEIEYETTNSEETFFADELQPYKEETMEIPEKLMPKIDFNEYCKDKYILDLGNYEIKEENGKTYAVRKQFEYPKTYEECCKVVNASPYVELVYNVSDGQKYSYDIDNLQIYENIRRLKICRDAYWKTAGDEMGLGKPWEPDWNDESEDKYSIVVHDNPRCYCNCRRACSILTFPTEEMRDVFYENFKYLITKCMKLL